MRYVLVTDLHGSRVAYDALQQVLQERGWATAGGLLRHADETLIVLGDSSDRGPLSLKLHLDFSRSQSVVHLMGNHDNKIVRWRGGYKGEFEPTRTQLEENPAWAKEVVDAVRDYPYRFVGPGFVAAHAYPFGSDEVAMYGPTKNQERVPWWEDYGLRDYATFFGHYHAKCDMLWPEKRLYCLDNLDSGVLTLAIIEDGKETIQHVEVGFDNNQIVC